MCLSFEKSWESDEKATLVCPLKILVDQLKIPVGQFKVSTTISKKAIKFSLMRVYSSKLFWRSLRRQALEYVDAIPPAEG